VVSQASVGLAAGGSAPFLIQKPSLTQAPAGAAAAAVQARSGGGVQLLPPKESNVIAVGAAGLPPAMRRSMWRVEADYELLGSVHEGPSSLVAAAICQRSGLPVALKVYRLDCMDDQQRVQLSREVRLHAQLAAHDHIVTMYAAFMVRHKLPRACCRHAS
jgi:hypothetical protein